MWAKSCRERKDFWKLCFNLILAFPDYNAIKAGKKTLALWKDNPSIVVEAVTKLTISLENEDEMRKFFRKDKLPSRRFTEMKRKEYGEMVYQVLAINVISKLGDFLEFQPLLRFLVESDIKYFADDRRKNKRKVPDDKSAPEPSTHLPRRT